MQRAWKRMKKRMLMIWMQLLGKSQTVPALTKRPALLGFLSFKSFTVCWSFCLSNFSRLSSQVEDILSHEMGKYKRFQISSGRHSHWLCSCLNLFKWQTLLKYDPQNVLIIEAVQYHSLMVRVFRNLVMCFFLDLISFVVLWSISCLKAERRGNSNAKLPWSSEVVDKNTGFHWRCVDFSDATGWMLAQRQGNWGSPGPCVRRA